MYKSLVTLALVCALSASVYAAPILTFSETGEDLTVTAQEPGGATTYWSMVVKTGAATAPGRITQFYDLTGASDAAYNYVSRYDLGTGLVDPNDNGSMRDQNKYSVAFDPYADGDTSLSYTVSRVETDAGGGTKTTTLDFVINVPDATGTKIDMATTLAFDALWTAANGQGRVRPQMNLHNTVAADNGEWTVDAYNGFPDGVGYSYIAATSTGLDTGSAAGRSFTMTLGWDAGDDAYDKTVVAYNTLGAPRLYGQIEQGITGAWAGKPIPGESYTATVDMDINIAIPEPATLSLLGLGLIGLLRRRKA